MVHTGSILDFFTYQYKWQSKKKIYLFIWNCVKRVLSTLGLSTSHREQTVRAGTHSPNAVNLRKKLKDLCKSTIGKICQKKIKTIYREAIALIHSSKENVSHRWHRAVPWVYRNVHEEYCPSPFKICCRKKGEGLCEKIMLLHNPDGFSFYEINPWKALEISFFCIK